MRVAVNVPAADSQPEETWEEVRTRLMDEVAAFRHEHGLSAGTRLAMKPCPWTWRMCRLCVTGCTLQDISLA